MLKKSAQVVGRDLNFRVLPGVAFSLLVLAAPALAQQPTKVPHIGYLTISPRGTQTHLIEAFERGLAERGYSIGRDIVIEYRFADGMAERLQGLAEDLVRMKVDLIVTGINPNIRAAQRATKSIPIVAAISYFPEEEGLVQSLAHPGGNVTGLTSDVAEEVGRRLQLLREAAPGISRVAVLYGRGEGYTVLALAKLEGAARRLGTTIIPTELRGPEDLDRAWAEILRNRADGLIGFGAAALYSRTRILRLSKEAKLPTMFSDRQYVDDGALMSYGADLADNFRKAAGYVDRILKGAKPADLPFEQPTRYVLAINLTTARALGLTIPQSLLLQADYVIEK